MSLVGDGHGVAIGFRWFLGFMVWRYAGECERKIG